MLGFSSMIGFWTCSSDQKKRCSRLTTLRHDSLLLMASAACCFAQEKSAEGFQEMLTAARAVAWTEKGLVSHEEEQSLPDEEEAGDERKEDQGEEEEDEEVQNAEDLTDWASVRHRLLGCSVIVGLHPDQATGAIVDFALKWYLHKIEVILTAPVTHVSRGIPGTRASQSYRAVCTANTSHDGSSMASR